MDSVNTPARAQARQEREENPALNTVIPHYMNQQLTLLQLRQAPLGGPPRNKHEVTPNISGLSTGRMDWNQDSDSDSDDFNVDYVKNGRLGATVFGNTLVNPVKPATDDIRDGADTNASSDAKNPVKDTPGENGRTDNPTTPMVVDTKDAGSLANSDENEEDDTKGGDAEDEVEDEVEEEDIINGTAGESAPVKESGDDAEQGDDLDLLRDDDFDEEIGGSDAEEEEDDVYDIIEQAKRRLASKKKVFEQVDHSKIDYEPFRKDFYVIPKELSKFTQEEIDELRNNLDGIRVRGVRCPPPIEKWTQLGLSSKVLDIIQRGLKFDKPTTIQMQGIPAVMSGRDVIGIAKTGSGKTLAFLLPLIRHVADQRPLRRGEGPIAIVMTPTRELASQIYKECKPFAKNEGLTPVCCYGGASIGEQIAQLKKGAEIVIGTPGRLLDLLCANNGRVTNLRRTTYVVLDEADRMFDMGFEPQVMRIVNNTRPDRQTILFSATFPRKMEALARKVLKKPIEITVGGKSVVGKDITQHIEIRTEDTKFDRLLEIINSQFMKDDESKVVVFVDRQDSVDKLFLRLSRNGIAALSLHGGKDQADRDSTIAEFKTGESRVLVATSIAARGLDVKLLRVVVSYDCPNHMEDYVHRCGRTGRAGTKGDAYTFITPTQDRYAPHIIKALEASGAEIPEELVNMGEAFKSAVESGEAYGLSSGFGGKGLERLEQDRVSLKRAQLAGVGDAAAAAAAQEDNKDKNDAQNKPKRDEKFIEPTKIVSTQLDSTIANDKKRGIEQVAKPDATVTVETKKSNVSPTVNTTEPKAEPKKKEAAAATPANPALNAALMAARARAAQISSKRQGSNEDLAGAAKSPTSSTESAQAQANDVLARINAKIKQRTQGQSSLQVSSQSPRSNTAPAQQSQRMKLIQDFTGEVEINDFPQKARWSVTNKETVTRISELSAAAITMRGTYVPEGRNPPPGEKKLHLYIEASTPGSLEKARQEIKRILAESTVHALESQGNRYNII